MANLSYGVSGSSYYDLARQQQVFAAYATITAPVAYSTAAGTGGPLLWNGSLLAPQRVNAVILGVSIAETVAETTAAIALGITGNSGQAAAPTSTSAATSIANLLIGGNQPMCSAYSVGTVANAGSFFLPLANLGTGALTVISDTPGLIDLAGAIVVPPGSWVSVSASAAATAAVLAVGLIWAEIPLR